MDNYRADGHHRLYSGVLVDSVSFLFLESEAIYGPLKGIAGSADREIKLWE